MSEANYLNMISGAAGNEIRVPEPAIIVLPETARAIQQNTEQLGAYLVQMGQIMLQMQNRLDELDEKQKLVTLSHDEVKGVQKLIRNRAFEYCEKYGLENSAYCQRTVAREIKKSILARYGVKDMHDVPAIAREAVENQIRKWTDIRLIYKCREKVQDFGN